MIKILIEGRGSEQRFWELILKVIYHNNSNIDLIHYDGICNLGTVFANCYNESDIFIVSADNVVDNPIAYNAVADFKISIYDKKNVFMLDFLCFESTLLSFRYIDSWMFSNYSRQNDNRIKYKIKLIKDFNKLQYEWRRSPEIEELMKKTKLTTISTENVANAIKLRYIKNEFSYN